MARKGGGRRSGKSSTAGGGTAGGGMAMNDGMDGADHLSESHTIVTLHSGGTNFDDDPSWTIHDENDDDQYHSSRMANSQLQSKEAAEHRHAKLVDCLGGSVEDFIHEKRSSQRESILKLWFKALTQYSSASHSADFVGQQTEGILAGCFLSMRIGNPSEQYAACRVIEALAVILASSTTWTEGIYREVEKYLLKLISSTHRASAVRAAAFRALGMVVFWGDEDEEDDRIITEATMDLCEQVAQKEYRGHTVSPMLRGAALSVWTVLATTLHDVYVSGRDDVSTGRGLLLLPLLLECLEQTEDLSLRASAGQCVTYIHAARVALGVVDEDRTKNGEKTTLNTTQRQYQQGSWEGSEWEGIMAEIEQTISDLSTQSGHHLSKKAKKEQRAYFRDYLATIQDNEDPEEVVQFRAGTLELTSWKDIVVLQFFRRCLQGGFQLQLLNNSAMQSVFGLALQQQHLGGLSQLEKRLFVSKTSEAVKLKDQDRHKKRDKRTNIKNHFLTADGEDI